MFWICSCNAWCNDAKWWCTDVQFFLINAVKWSMKMECESFQLVPHHSPHDHSELILLCVERQRNARRSTEIDRDQLKLLQRMWREKNVWSWPCCFYHCFPFASGSFFLFVWKSQAVILFGEKVMLCRAMSSVAVAVMPCVSTTCVSSLTFYWIMLVTVIFRLIAFFGQQTFSKIDVFRSWIGISASQMFFFLKVGGQLRFANMSHTFSKHLTVP